MVQLVKTSSFRKATSMFKRMGLGSMGKDDSSESDSDSHTADSRTFISGLTEDIPDMRDDSVQSKLVVPQPRIKPPLPPKRPKPLQMDLKSKSSKKTAETPKLELSEPRTPPPSVITSRSIASSSKLPPSTITARSPSTITTTKSVASSSKPPPVPKPVAAAPAPVAVAVAVAKQTSNNSPPTPNVDFVTANLDSVPRLLLEEVLSSNHKIVEDAVDRLARRCRKSDEIRDETYRAGGHAIVIMAMRRWRDNEIIQAGGCRCITNMTCQFPDAKRSFALIGGVETAVVAMQQFPGSVQVQGYGCGALMNIMCGHKAETSDVGLTMADRFVNHLDGIRIVVKAMTAFPEDAKIQLGGCGLFQNLAQNKAFIYSMMQEGAVAAVGSSLTAHPSDPNIKRAAGSFMKKVFA